MRILARLLDDMGITGTIAADQDGYPGILGYRGPALSEVTGAEVVPAAADRFRRTNSTCSKAPRMPGTGPTCRRW